MDFERFLNAALAMPQPDQWRIGALLLAILAAMGLVLFRERRHFKQRELAGSWLALRLLGLVLLLPLTVAAVLVPALSISGMEALAFFYGTLFTLAPLVWFGGHILFGRLLRPALSRAQSVFLALSGLVIVAIPAYGLLFGEGPIRLALQGGEARSDQLAAAIPLAHVAQAPRRYTLPEIGIVYAQTLSAGDGIRLERVEAINGQSWGSNAESPYPTFCRHEDDVHLLWSAGEPPPRLRLYWRQADGRRLKGVFAPAQTALAAATDEAFTISFRDNGFDPPAPIPRRRAEAGRGGDPKALYFNHLNQPQPGDNPGNDCLMRGYKRFEWQQEGPIRALAILFPSPRGQLRAEIRASTGQP